MRLPPQAGGPTAGDVPALKVGPLDSEIRVDGRLDEPAWTGADAIRDLTMIEPTQGGTPTGRTTVRVLANRRVLVLGIECDDPEPSRIVGYSKQRDAAMSSEDHIELAIDPSFDGATKRLYVSSGEGFLDVFQQADPSHFTRTAHVATAPGARTSLYVPEQNRLYLAVPYRGDQKAAIRVYDVRD